MKYDKSVYRSLALITQFGINMLVPIFLCTIVGVSGQKIFNRLDGNPIVYRWCACRISQYFYYGKADLRHRIVRCAFC